MSIYSSIVYNPLVLLPPLPGTRKTALKQPIFADDLLTKVLPPSAPGGGVHGVEPRPGAFTRKTTLEWTTLSRLKDPVRCRRDQGVATRGSSMKLDWPGA